MIPLDSFKDEIVTALLERDKCCVLCEESNREFLVAHEIVPNFQLPLPEGCSTVDTVVVLCKACCHKIETMANSPYLSILEKNGWSKITLPGEVHKPMFKNLLTNVRRMSYMHRFAPEIFLRPENIAEHSFWVAQFALAISAEYVKNDKINTTKLVMMALFHDMAEIITTDVPTPIKRSSKGTEDFYEKLEKLAVRKLENDLGQRNLELLIDEFNSGDSIEAQIVRAADKVAGIQYAFEESSLGNRNFFLVIRRMYKHLGTYATGNSTNNYRPEWLTTLYSDIHHWLTTSVSSDILKEK